MLEIEQVRAFSQMPSPLLSVYVDCNPAKPTNQGPNPEYMAWLNSAGRAVAAGIPIGERKLFDEQWKRVQMSLRDPVSGSRSVVIFAGEGIWYRLPVPLDLENELHWGKPLLFPLLALFDGHKPCAILVVDRAGARFFRYGLGEMIELEERKFEIDISQWRRREPGKVAAIRDASTRGTKDVKKSRGATRDTFDRRVEAQYRRLCGEIATRAVELCGRHRLGELFLVGSNRLTAPIAEALPRKFHPRIVKIEEDLGRIVMPDLAERIAPAVAEWTRARETQEVDELLGDVAHAVTGIDAALAELQQGKTRHLIVDRRLHGSARQCRECGWTDRSANQDCPACGAERQLIDLRESLPGLAWSHGAEIQIVGGEAAQRLASAEGIAARLRQSRRAGRKRSAAGAR